MTTAQALYDALCECEEYLDARADVIDGDYGVPEANREMRLLTIVRDAIAQFETPERILPCSGSGASSSPT